MTFVGDFYFKSINPNTILSKLVDTELYTKYIEDVYTGLGFCYSLNPNFKEDALTNPS